MSNLPTSNLPNQHSSHYQQFIQLFGPSLNSGTQPIDLYNLKHLVLHGIPDHPSHIRPLVWDLLLAINSPNSGSQPINQRRHEYHELMSYFVQQLHPSVSYSSSISTTIDQNLRWIQADINRTQSDLQFFSTPFQLPPDSLAAIKLNVFISHLNQAQPPPLSNSDFPHPSLSGSPSPSFCSAPSSSSSSYYSSSSKSKTNSSVSPSTPARTKSPFSPSTRPSNSSQPPSHQSPKIHSINTLLEASSPSTPRLNIQAPSPIISPRESINSTSSFTYRDLLSRLLAVWSTLNPGIGYVQGMSDIAAVIVYVYSQSYHLPHHDQNHPLHQVLETGSDHEDMEADAFWAFSALVSNLRELFVNSLDGTPTRIESSFGMIFHRYAQQLDWIDPELSHHLRSLGVEGKFYVLSWLGCLFTRCFNLPELLRVWDSIFALNLDTHRASITTNSGITSTNSDQSLLNTLIDVCCSLTIQLGAALKQQNTFERIMSILQTVRAQNVSVESLIELVLIIRQRRFAAGLDQQPDQVTPPPLPIENPIASQTLGTLNSQESEIIRDNATLAIFGSSTWSGLTRLKTLAVDATQRIPSSSIVADTPTTDPHENLGAGIFQKLKHTTEGWRDSDVAAELSKKATNWSLMASSWGTSSLSKLTSSAESSAAGLEPSPIPSFSPTNGRSMHGFDPNLHAPQFSSVASSPQASSHRWSKTSHTSNFSFDSPFQPPISSCSDSLSASSSTLGSPIHPNNQLTGVNNGPRPLLLSSRVRTSVMTTPESASKVHDMLNASIKRLSGFKLGINLAQSNEHLDSNDNHLNITPVDRISPNVRLAHDIPVGLHPSSLSTFQGSTMVNIFSRNRARSVFSPSVNDRHKGDLSSKPERVSLPNNIVGRQRHVLTQRCDEINSKSDEVEVIKSTQRKLVQNNNVISKENGISEFSDRTSCDTFDDVVDEYVSLYGA